MTLTATSYESLAARLNDTALDDAWLDIVNSWEGGSSEQREELLGGIRGQRSCFLELMKSVDDSEDIAYAMLLLYLELKSNWTLLNMSINYIIVNTGESPEQVMYRAALTAHLLVALEAHIDEDDISKLTKFIAEPVKSV
jgi:hypothetical protein